MATGIVRRIDELGRIVIPKEMRRTMRLKEGDEMEILSDGAVITLRKYSGIESVLKTAGAVSALLAEKTGADALFISTESALIAEGKNKKRYLGAKVSDRLASVMRSRTPEVLSGDAAKGLFDVRDGDRCYAAVEPVIVGGDLIGAAVLMMSEEPNETAKSYLHFCVKLIEANLG